MIEILYKCDLKLTTDRFAGSDTTAIAIRSILYHLMKDKTCMEKLVVEID